MVLKFKPKLNSKFMLKGGNTIKTMKGSKKESKRHMFCVYKRTRNINILWQQGNSYYIILFLALVYEHLMDILNVKSIGKEHLNVFLTEEFIEKNVFCFWIQ